MAGGGAMPEQGGGHKQKKKLDAVINVVPAIDLLSCCISFLLFTAVWTQISRLQAQQLGTPAAAPTPVELKQLQITLSLTEKGLVLSTSAGGSTDIPSLGRSPEGTAIYDIKTLAAKLKQLKTEYPDQSAITVAAEDGVLYADLVRVMDTCVGAGLAGIAVTAAG